MPQTFVLPRQTALDDDANPLAGALLYFFATGTTNPQAVYADAALTTPHSHPIVADSSGEFPKIYLSQSVPANYRVRLTTAAGVQLYQEDDIDRFTITQEELAESLYPQTEPEDAQDITPEFLIYAPSPKIDVRRYLTAWDDGSTQTTGLQTALNYAKARKGWLILPDGLDVATGALSLTFTGNRITDSLVIEGAGMNSSIIRQVGSPTALLTLQASSPSTVHTEAQIMLANFMLQGVSGKTAHGISLKGIAGFKFDHIQVRQFNRALNLESALVGVICGDSRFTESNYGIYARKSGTAASCNAITIQDTQIKYNSSWGIDFNNGSLLRLIGLDIEQNGTTSNLATGGVALGDDMDAETGFGFGHTMLYGCWLERNFGRSLLVSSQAGIVKHFVDLQNCLIAAAEDGHAMYVAGAEFLNIHNCASPTPGDTWNITCQKLRVSNSQVDTLNDSGAVYTTYENFSTSSVDHISGRVDSYQATLTNVSGTVTGTVVIVEQGRRITATVSTPITGTSNNTSVKSLTGMPARFRPSTSKSGIGVTTDNGTDKFSQITVQTNGDIVLANGLSSTYTGSGTAGVQFFRMEYEKA